VGMSVGVAVAVGVGVSVGGLIHSAARCDCVFTVGTIASAPQTTKITATAATAIDKYGNGCGSRFAPQVGHTVK